jgi:hypothetical protein
MIPFACIQCRTKRIKTNLTIGKENKTEEGKKICRDPNGPLAREPYGPPGPYIWASMYPSITYIHHGTNKGEPTKTI